jgi:hypothetical protein
VTAGTPSRGWIGDGSSSVLNSIELRNADHGLGWRDGRWPGGSADDRSRAGPQQGRAPHLALLRDRRIDAYGDLLGPYRD